VIESARRCIVPAIVNERYFEEFQVGQKFRSGTVSVTAEKIKAFAAEFDPQPFHLDEEAAKTSLFRGLAASGWHTAALTMRLLVDSDLKPAGGTIGAGGEDLRWPRPVRPGDVLHLEAEVLEARPSRSKPDLGIVKLRLTTYNQAQEPVQISTPVLMVGRRPG
jgi:acyl dehydratase